MTRMETYTAEKWTIISNAQGEHELWATLNNIGNLVALGSRQFCEKYAGRLNANAGYLFPLSKLAAQRQAREAAAIRKARLG